MKVELQNILTRNDYYDGYKKSNNQTEPNENLVASKKEKALEMALDIRKFEIELYWKRATYFATFIGLMFTSYFVVATAGTKLINEVKFELMMMISAIGIFASLCWFFVNKGSKYWQENWELHVDLLEDDVMGPLYKTTKKCNNEWKLSWKFWNIFFERRSISPFLSYKYSVGKINIFLSFMTVIMWVSLFVRTICDSISLPEKWHYFNEIGIFVFLMLSVLFLCMKCKSTGFNGQDKENISFTKRKIDDDYEEAEPPVGGSESH